MSYKKLKKFSFEHTPKDALLRLPSSGYVCREWTTIAGNLVVGVGGDKVRIIDERLASTVYEVVEVEVEVPEMVANAFELIPEIEFIAFDEQGVTAYDSEPMLSEYEWWTNSFSNGLKLNIEPWCDNWQESLISREDWEKQK